MLWIDQLEKDDAAMQDFIDYIQSQIRAAISDGDSAHTLEGVMVARGRKLMLLSIENKLTARARADRSLANFNANYGG